MKILVMARKELKVIVRETGGLMFMFLMPIAFLVMFNLIFSGSSFTSQDRPFKLPVVNQDKGELGAQIISRLEAISWVKAETSKADGTPLDEAAAIERVEKGDNNQALIIPADFTQKTREGAAFKLPLYVDPSVPIQYIGPVEGAVTGALYAVVMRDRMQREVPKRIDEMIAELERGFGMPIPPAVRAQISGEKLAALVGEKLFFGFDETGNQLPVVLDKRQPPSIKRDEFPTMYQQNLSGYSVLAVFFIVTSIGAAFFSERERGTFRRILAAPVSRAAFLAGKLLPYVLINILQVAVLVLLSIFIYHTNLGSSPLALLLITICLSTSAVGLGLLMVTLFRSPQRMEAVAVVAVLVSSALSGAFVPRFVMGDFVQKLSLGVPQSWGLMAYQDVMVRGKGLLDVLPHCGVILAFAAGFFLIALARFRFE